MHLFCYAKKRRDAKKKSEIILCNLLHYLDKPGNNVEHLYARTSGSYKYCTKKERKTRRLIRASNRSAAVAFGGIGASRGRPGRCSGNLGRWLAGVLRGVALPGRSIAGWRRGHEELQPILLLHPVRRLEAWWWPGGAVQGCVVVL